jgi:hypothetical protein
VIVRWRTSVSTDSKVWYGAQAGSLTGSVVDTNNVTEHQLTLTGLNPSTRYYYAVGSTTQMLAGNDANHFFITSPPLGDTGKTRIWVLGDSGTANSNAQAVRNAYYSYTGSTHTDLWLMLGDNAYPDGTDSDYQSAVFNMYPTMLRKSVLWSTLGNHDGHSADSGSQSGPYYNIFTLPKQGEAGGLASGTEAYYSFDRGQIHFVCLDSYDSPRRIGGAMMTWLDKDLDSTLQPWTIAFFHHPPYSKGSHDSDSEVELIEMRENALPILEAHGVDLVLSGHSHSYERSYLIDGHYGKSSTFSSSMKKDGGDGRVEGTGAYWKPSEGPAGHEGAVYAVAGSSGQTSSGSLNHPAMFVSMGTLGSMVLDVEGSRLDALFLTSSGKTGDHFTILKGSQAQAPAAPQNLQAQAVSTDQIDLAWQDLSTNEESFSIEMSPQGGSWAEVGTVAANVEAYAATGLSPLSTYNFRVRAKNVTGDSPYSNVDSATTLGLPDPGGTGGTGDQVAVSETKVVGSRSGSLSGTWSDDGVYETLTEVQKKGQNRTNWLEWKWVFEVKSGIAVTLFVKAYQSVSNDGDNFVFSYSTDDSTFTDLLIVSKTSDDGSYQSQALPPTLQGTVYLRVRDTRRDPVRGSNDKIFIDHLFIRSE